MANHTYRGTVRNVARLPNLTPQARNAVIACGYHRGPTPTLPTGWTALQDEHGVDGPPG